MAIVDHFAAIVQDLQGSDEDSQASHKRHRSGGDADERAATFHRPSYRQKCDYFTMGGPGFGTALRSEEVFT